MICHKPSPALLSKTRHLPYGRQVVSYREDTGLSCIMRCVDIISSPLYGWEGMAQMEGDGPGMLIRYDQTTLEGCLAMCSIGHVAGVYGGVVSRRGIPTYLTCTHARMHGEPRQGKLLVKLDKFRYRHVLRLPHQGESSFVLVLHFFLFLFFSLVQNLDSFAGSSW